MKTNMFKNCATLMLLATLAMAASAARLTEELEGILATKSLSDQVPVILFLTEQSDRLSLDNMGFNQRYKAICNQARITQQPIVDLIKGRSTVSNLKQYTVANAISATMDKSTVLELSKRSDIALIMHDTYVKGLLPHENNQLNGAFAPGGEQIPWNIEVMGAPRAWDLGYSGQGVIIGIMDTGSDITHPALARAYRQFRNTTGTQDQYSWFNAFSYGSQNRPFDDNGHGTGTAGFVAAQYNMGIAPNCGIIVCKVMDSLGSGQNSHFLSGFNWFFNLPDTFRPKAVSNSWGFSSGNDTLFWQSCLNWKNVGILPVFSNGNEGENGAGSVGRPGRLPTVLGVGATDDTDELLYYSSLGPAPNVNPINNATYWYRTDWNRHKPDVCAPAEPTTTTAPGNAWQSFSGTSASCPHVAGQVAILASKNPALTPTQLYNIITNNTDLPMAYYRSFPNDSFGWGRANIFRALQAVPEPTTPHIVVTSVVVRDSVSGCDNDGFLDPNECTTGVPVRITVRNLGAEATSCSLRIISEDHDSSTILSAGWKVFTRIPRNADSTFTTTGTYSKPRLFGFPEATYANFLLSIHSNGGTYKKNEVLRFFVPYQNKPATIDTLIKDAGTHTYHLGNDAAAYNADNYFATKFTTAASCSVTGVIWYMDGTITTRESIFVWADNGSGQPGSRLGYTTVTSITQDAWQTVSLPQAIWVPSPGDLWFGVRKESNSGCVPYQDNGSTANMNFSSILDQPATWRNGTYWYDFEMRPIIKMNPVDKPVVRWNEEDHIDDSRYGNNDGGLDPGEQVGWSLALRNYGIPVNNLTAKIRPADALTAARVTVLDSTSTFGTVQNGNDGGDNHADPFQIRMWDGDTLTGEDLTFKMVINGGYGTGNGTAYNDSFNVTIAGPWVPQPGDTLFYPMGSDGLWLLTDYLATGTFATVTQFGLLSTDSIWVDTIYYYGRNNSTAARDLIFYLWQHNPSTGLPGAQIASNTTSVPASTGQLLIKYGFHNKLPGIFWYGQNCTSNGARIEPIFWGEPLIGIETFFNATQTANWTAAASQDFASMPHGAYFEIRHDHPALSYYRPTAMDWPIVPSHTPGGDVLPATLSGTQPTYIKDFSAVNRSGINISVPAKFEDYLFLDNWGLAVDSVSTLNAWSYRTASTSGVDIPGGRHTLFGSLDWNGEVSGNVFNSYLRNWGMQFSWTPGPASSGTAYTAEAPMQYGIASGPYDNCVAYACTLKSKTISGWRSRWWNVFGVRPKHFNKTQDSIDVDLLLYSDAPTTPYNGYTNIKEASLLGPNQVDFVVANHQQIGTDPFVLYMGSYSYSDLLDSVYMQYSQPICGLVMGGSLADTVAIAANDVVKLYEVYLPAGAASITADVISGDIDIGLAIFGKSPDGDYYKQRSAALATADANGSGGDEVLSFTAAAADTFALVIFSNGDAAKASGSFRITGISSKTAPMGPLAVSFASMSASIINGNQLQLRWRTESESNSYQWLVERSNNPNSGYELRGTVAAAGNATTPTDYEYTDNGFTQGIKYYYRLAEVDLDGTTTYYGPLEVGPFRFTPASYELSAARPNPFSGSTVINYQIKEPGRVTLRVYNVAGQLVKTLVDGPQAADFYRVTWNGETDKGTRATNGVYFCTIQANEFSATRRMVKLR